MRPPLLTAIPQSIFVKGSLHSLQICPRSIFVAVLVMYCQYFVVGVGVEGVLLIFFYGKFIIQLQIRGMRDSDQYEDEFYDGEDTNRRAYMHNPDHQDQPQPQPQKPRKKYGSMIVLYDGKFLLTLGPDYWCFLPTFAIFCTVSFFTIRFVITSTTNLYLQLATVVICGGMCLSYLAVATSNPGMITKQNQPTPQPSHSYSHSQSTTQTLPSPSPSPPTTKQCKRCQLTVPRKAYHCPDCDICILQYDHHCPWTSKCIGGGNLCRFYLFLGMVPLYLVYSFMVFGIVMSQLAMEQAGRKIGELVAGTGSG